MKLTIITILIFSLSGCIPAPSWAIREELVLGSIDTECIRKVIAKHSLVKGVVLNDPSITYQDYDSDYYQYIIETEMGFAYVSATRNKSNWKVISHSYGHTNEIPIKTKRLAPSFHKEIANEIKSSC